LTLTAVQVVQSLSNDPIAYLKVPHHYRIVPQAGPLRHVHRGSRSGGLRARSSRHCLVPMWQHAFGRRWEWPSFVRLCVTTIVWSRL
jgi:hypothetical protein